MGMLIDDARREVPAAAVDHHRAIGVEIIADRFYQAVAHQHIGYQRAFVLIGPDRGAADNEVLSVWYLESAIGAEWVEHRGWQCGHGRGGGVFLRLSYVGKPGQLPGQRFARRRYRVAAPAVGFAPAGKSNAIAGIVPGQNPA